ncbi:hypothetical protein B0A48_17293 [Cryoendolithus antarcticus]|uniref:Uncharacterized protein n=1 Tax=Cryoendolithus antarcticus TaxID=1507870 RepID=A0A1V8SC47_9PEZI|nr:hypothetical protein B0A48_17293 [Cryoendolithus antarcticus]
MVDSKTTLPAFGKFVTNMLSVLGVGASGQVLLNKNKVRAPALVLATEAQASQIIEALTEEDHAIAGEQVIATPMRDAVVKLSVGRLQKVIASGKATKAEIEHTTE